MSVVEGIFWISAFCVLYPYALYPLGIWGLSRVSLLLRPQKPFQQPETWPEVTIVIPAYKEHESVVPKMESIRKLDYPKDKLRVLWVISTHEGDETLPSTLAALQAYPEADLLLLPREGKSAALNQAREKVTSELVLISDANALLSPQSLKAGVLTLLQPPVAGAVGGRRVLLSEADGIVAPTEGLFFRYEDFLLRAESSLNIATSLFGEFCLFPRHLWPQIPRQSADDIYILIHVGQQGLPIRYSSTSVVYQTTSPDLATEFRRKARIAYTVFYALKYAMNLSKLLRNVGFFIALLSHKLFRYVIVPIALIANLMALLWLSWEQPYSLYTVLLGAELIVWGGAFVTLSCLPIRLPKVMGSLSYFILAHLAQLVGLWKFMRGEDVVKVWQRLPRAEPQPSPS